MASTWSALKVELLETGANAGSWGTLTNANLGDAVLGEAITGQATVDFSSDADVTITLTDSASTQAARNLRLNITESSTGIGSVRNLILGSGCQIEKFYLINNTGTGAKTIKNTSGTGISVPAGKATLVYNNGTNVVDAASYFTSLTLGSALPITSGGTGTTSTTFANLASNVTGTLPVANGGTGLTAGTSGGIPAYTATGTLTSSGALTQYGVVIGGGAGAVPTSTAVGTATHVLTSNGAGVAPTFQALPAGGVTTFTAGTTGFTPSTATSGAVTLAGTLAVANGGTGQTSYTNGQLLIGNTTGNTLTKATLTQGTGITITNSTGSITVANSGVTSVGGTGTVNGLSLSGTVTTTGNLTLGGTLSGVANSALTNSSVTVTAGTGMSGGGAVALGSSVTLTNAGVTSVNGSTGAVTVTGSQFVRVLNTTVSSAVSSIVLSVDFSTYSAYQFYVSFPNSSSGQSIGMQVSTNGGSSYFTGGYILNDSGDRSGMSISSVSNNRYGSGWGVFYAGPNGGYVAGFQPTTYGGSSGNNFGAAFSYGNVNSIRFVAGSTSGAMPDGNITAGVFVVYGVLK